MIWALASILAPCGKQLCICTVTDACLVTAQYFRIVTERQSCTVAASDIGTDVCLLWNIGTDVRHGRGTSVAMCIFTLSFGTDIGYAIGDVGTVPGVVLVDYEDTRDAGLALLGVGLVGKFIGNSVEPRADTRTWNNLPQHLSFAALQLPAGEHPATLDFLDTTGAALPDRKKSVLLTVQAGRDTVLLVADR